MKIFLISIMIIMIVGIGLFAFPQSKISLDKSVRVDSIVVEKSKREMYVYAKGVLLKTYIISLGINPSGDKQFEGDNKTPEGMYYIYDKNPNSKFNKSIGISYPDNQDIKEAKESGKNPGGQIKIHGIKKGFSWIGRFHRIIDWTAGCIAVTDDEIDELYNAVSIGIPIEIKP